MLSRSCSSLKCSLQAGRIRRQASSRAFLASRHGKRDRQAADVVPGDLAATLDAHRRSNTALKIRRSNGPVKPSPGLSSDREAVAEAHQTQNGNLPTKQSQRTSVRKFQSNHDLARKEHREIEESTWKLAAQHERPQRRAIDAHDLLPVSPGNPPFTPYLPQDWQELGIEIRELVNLDYTMTSFASWIRLSDSEKHQRKKLAAAFIDAMNLAKPSLSFHLQGSLSQGLATPLSDINVAFSQRDKHSLSLDPALADTDSKIARSAAKSVERLPMSLQRAGFELQGSHAAEGDRVVCMLHKATGLRFNLRWDIRPSFEQSLAARLVEAHPHFTPLFLLLRTSLDMRGLLDWTVQGLGSYTLIMMLAAYFQLHPAFQMSRLSTSLFKFLDFYGNLNTGIWWINPLPSFHLEALRPLNRRGGAKKDPFKPSAPSVKQPCSLQIGDPLSHGKIIGRHAHRIMDIRKTFRALSQESQSIHRHNVASEKDLKDPLAPFLGDTLGHIKATRHLCLLASSPESDLTRTSEYERGAELQYKPRMGEL